MDNVINKKLHYIHKVLTGALVDLDTVSELIGELADADELAAGLNQLVLMKVEINKFRFSFRNIVDAYFKKHFDIVELAKRRNSDNS